MTKDQSNIIKIIKEMINQINILNDPRFIQKKLNIAKSIYRLISKYAASLRGYRPTSLQLFFSNDEVLASFSKVEKKTLISVFWLLEDLRLRTNTIIPPNTYLFVQGIITNIFKKCFFLSEKSPELYQYLLDLINKLGPLGNFAVSIAKHKLFNTLYEQAIKDPESTPSIPKEISQSILNGVFQTDPSLQHVRDFKQIVDLQFEKTGQDMMKFKILTTISIILNHLETVYEIYEISPRFFTSAEFYLAIEFNRLELVQFLIEKKSSEVNSRFSDDETPLSLAGFTGNLEILNYLLEKGANPRLRIKRMVWDEEPRDLGSNFERVLNYQLDNENPKNMIAILEMFFNKDPSLIHFSDLTDCHEKPIGEKDQGLTLLEWICFSEKPSSKLEIIQYLVSKKAPFYHPNNPYRTALNMTVNYYFNDGESALQLKVLKYFIEELKIPISDLEIEGIDSVLGLACEHFHMEIILYLIEKGSNVLHKEHFGMTPLMLLIHGLDYLPKHPPLENLLYTIKCLVAAGSDIHAIDKNGNNLLHLLLEIKEDDTQDLSTVLEYLFEQGVSVLQKNHKGLTPLDMIEKMLKQGASSVKKLKTEAPLSSNPHSMFNNKDDDNYTPPLPSSSLNMTSNHRG